MGELRLSNHLDLPLGVMPRQMDPIVAVPILIHRMTFPIGLLSRCLVVSLSRCVGLALTNSAARVVCGGDVKDEIFSQKKMPSCEAEHFPGIRTNKTESSMGRDVHGQFYCT